MNQQDDTHMPAFREDVDAAQRQSSCGCSGPPTGVNRRQFMKVAGVGLVATTLGRALPVMAGPFKPSDAEAGHLVPADKQLDPAWVKALFERGTKEVFSGKALDNIGMPCGGIGCGQLYLCGDGALGSWQIFNNAKSNWIEGTHATYKHRGIPKTVDQGFAVWVRQGDGAPAVKRLGRDGFANIEFQGEYPIGAVRYAEPGFPVKVEMEAFSPFIPLNAKDSGLPATLFHLTVQNTSSKEAQVRVLGWLENAVCLEYGQQFKGLRKTAILEDNGRGFVLHSAMEPPKPDQPEPAKERPPMLFETFEGDDYGAWQVEGKAFGAKPARGTLENQQAVSGYEGEGLVNTFLGGDASHGTLTSPPFTINRTFINFLIGGGGHADATCMNLEVDGEVVRTATGRNNETLAWRAWNVAEFEGQEARLVIVDEAGGGWGHINIDQIEFADKRREGEPVPMTSAADFGTLALACLEPAGVDPAGIEAVRDLTGETCLADGEHVFDVQDTRLGVLGAPGVELAPGESRTFTFVLAWHFPNQANGHAYAARFADAGAVARYVLDNHDRLAAHTRLWRDTYYDGSLPYWLLDRLHSTVSTLATGTCQWWKNGRFWAYEGVTCCQGTCTHVWNYAHAHARLFPEIARSIREMQDLCPREQGGGFHPDTGLVGFRSNDAYAADGQCGSILKAYREHLTSPDRAFLERNWPRIKKALEYSISHDANADGLIEDSQHNTYDINYEGANTFVGSLYLAALRAGEEMAREVGDDTFAETARAIYDSGRRLTLERLWSGEYFTQDVDLEKYPKHQYGPGCLSDHLFGQGWAHQLALGYIYPIENVRSALEAVWKYNWAPDVTPYNEAYKPFRWFITPGQAGLFTCTWPHGDYLPEGTVYKNEVWTGIEYQVAGHMIWEGFLTEGLAICRAVHDRYHPDLFNPYNEVECGDHYARAMASWGVYLALAGFEHHGPHGHLGFAPRITPEHFRAAFTAAEGWGTFQQDRDDNAQREQIAVRWGTLRLKSLAFAVPEKLRPAPIKVVAAGEEIEAKATFEDRRVHLELDQDVVLNEGEALEVRFGSGVSSAP